MSRAAFLLTSVAALLCAWAATAAEAAPAGASANAVQMPTATSAAAAAPAAAVPIGVAIVVRDQTVLRAGPRESAPQLATLWQGEALEVRGERLDHLQVWDYHRERGGYVRADALHRVSTTEADAPALFAVLRFVRDQRGAESLGIGVAAAWLQAATPEQLRGPAGVEAFDALGGFAERIAERATAGAAGNPATEKRIAAQLDVAARYGLRFKTFERDGAVQVCYDGDAFRRVLAAKAEPAQQARAVLALTRAECIDPALTVTARGAADDARAALLERVDGAAFAALPPTLRTQLAARQAGVLGAVAFRRARLGQPADTAAGNAIAALGRVAPGERSDADQVAANDAAMRVNASRWAAHKTVAPSLRALALRTTAGAEPGQTCVELVESRGAVVDDGGQPVGPALVRRCTFAQVWPASATVNREGNAVALAVQPSDAWRELWLFRRVGRTWSVDVLPPSTSAVGIGYAEFAGWVPGGMQVLVARESRVEGRHRRSFEVLSLATLAVDRQAADPAALGAFQRWKDPAWWSETVGVR